MYICVTHVDSIFKHTIKVAPLSNGPAYPDIKGLDIKFWNETEWPTSTPLFYGICDDDADITIEGVVEVLSEEEYKAKRESQYDLKSFQIRAERDRRIFLAQNEIDKALRLERMGLSHLNISDLDAYIQLLANIPEQEDFPWDVTWPVFNLKEI